MTYAAIDAIKDLCGMDHGILGREQAQKLAVAMGLDDRSIPTYALEHQPDTLKGARLDGCTKTGQKRVGIGADELAEWACEELDLFYINKLGRGSRLRECCDVLYKHFGGE